MAYNLDISRDVREYIRDHPDLSRATRIRLYASLNDDLRNCTDDYRNDPARRVPTCPDLFYCWFPIWDDYLAGRPVRTIRFFVSDAFAAVGVLQLVFVDVIDPEE